MNEPSPFSAVVFYAACGFTLLVPALAAYAGKDASFVVAVTVPGALVLLVSRLHFFAEFSLGPLQAKMRETISDTNEALDKLREMAPVIARASLAQLMGGNFGFASGLDLKGRLDMADAIIANLEQIGVPPHRIAWARAEWDDGVTAIFFREIRHRFERRKARKEINPDEPERRAVGEKLQDLLSFDEGWAAPSSSTIRQFLKSNGYSELDPSVEEVLADYRHFEVTKEIRNRAAFVEM